MSKRRTLGILPCLWCKKQHRSRRVFYRCITTGFGEALVEILADPIGQGQPDTAPAIIVAKLQAIRCTIPNP